MPDVAAAAPIPPAELKTSLLDATRPAQWAACVYFATTTMTTVVSRPRRQLARRSQACRGGCSLPGGSGTMAAVCTPASTCRAHGDAATHLNPVLRRDVRAAPPQGGGGSPLASLPSRSASTKGFCNICGLCLLSCITLAALRPPSCDTHAGVRRHHATDPRRAAGGGPLHGHRRLLLRASCRQLLTAINRSPPVGGPSARAGRQLRQACTPLVVACLPVRALSPGSR